MLSCGATLQRLFVFFDAAKVGPFFKPTMGKQGLIAQKSPFFDAHQKNSHFRKSLPKQLFSIYK